MKKTHNNKSQLTLLKSNQYKIDADWLLQLSKNPLLNNAACGILETDALGLKGIHRAGGITPIHYIVKAMVQIVVKLQRV